MSILFSYFFFFTWIEVKDEILPVHVMKLSTRREGGGFTAEHIVKLRTILRRAAALLKKKKSVPMKQETV